MTNAEDDIWFCEDTDHAPSIPRQTIITLQTSSFVTWWKGLDILAKADGAEDFKALMPSALEALAKRAREVAGGRVALDRLIIAKRVSREAGGYRQRNDQADALGRLKRAGCAVHPGEMVRFVLTTGGAVPAELLSGDETYDAERYLDLLARAGESLFCFAGIGRDEILAKWKV